MVFRKRLTHEQRAFALFLHQEKKYSLRQVAARASMSKTSVWRIVHGLKRSSSTTTNTKRRGRRQLLSVRDKRKLKRAVILLRQENPNFSVMDVVKRSGIPLNTAHYRTFLRAIKRFGYKFQASRRKGILTDNDMKRRREFAKVTMKYGESYWTKDVSFYLDGVSFIYKGNPLSDAIKPKGRIWRKKSEGLTVTTKGSKDLAGGKRLHLMVAISYGRGVVLAEPYEKMNADFFARFIRRHFPNLFEIAGKGEEDNKIFVMDNDPSQTSTKAMAVLADLGYAMQKIPPRSPDLNPIENIFHLVRKRIDAQVRANNVTHQTWDEFKQAVQYNIWSTSKDLIDKTISTMQKRLQQIVKTHGRRTKY